MLNFLLGFLVLVAVLVFGGIILRPMVAQRRGSVEDYLVAGMVMVLLVPFLVFVAAHAFNLYIDIPFLLSLALIVGVIGLFYRFKRRR